MKKRVTIAVITLLLLCLSACGTTPVTHTQEGKNETIQNDDVMDQQFPDTERNVLVVYFSATGTTKPIAEYIAEATNADLFEIIPAVAYSNEDLDYNNSDCRANQEQNDSSSRPEIKENIENIAQYDTVFIGHPIWWGEEPRIIDTFIESYDFSGKTLVNFCTSGGSGISTSTENLKALSSQNATWLEGKRFESGASIDDVNNWITELNLNFKE